MFGIPVSFLIATLLIILLIIGLIQRPVRNKNIGGPSSSQPPSIPPATGQPTKPTGNFCIHCGAPNLPDASSCATCGLKLPEKMA